MSNPLGSVVNLETLPGKTIRNPDVVGYTSDNANILSNPLAVFSTTVSVTIHAGSPGSTGSVTVGPLPLTTFPASITPPTGVRYVVVPTVELAADIATPLVGLPYVALTFGSGSTLTKLGAGPANWTLLPSSTYSNLAIGATFQLYYPTKLNSSISVPVAVEAVMYAVSP